MRRARRILLGLGLLAVLAIAVFMIVVRTQADTVGETERLADTGFVRARNFFVDVYGVRTSSSVILFDAAMGSQGHALDVLLADLGAKREDVTHVFLTHGHPDHYASAPVLPNARVYAGEADRPMFSGERKNPKLVPQVFGAIMPAPPVVEIDEGLDGDRRIEIDGGKEAVVAIPLPGHSPGSYGFIFHGVLILGDAANYGGEMLTGPVPPFTEDLALAHRSLAKLPALVRDHGIEHFCTGHGGCSPKGRAKALAEALVASLRE